MRYHALACDYDGTVATHGALDGQTRGALERLRASGRKLLLVTGRRIDDLEGVCPDLTLFDAVVGENGALVYRPATRETRLLAARPPDTFVAALRARGVEPLDAGQVIVATWHPHETVVLDTIRELGLELHVIFNKGAVMVLPSGVNKATGLDGALADLALSVHNVVAVGDAENDHAFLAHCECGVAVANAVESLKAEADLVTTATHGAGVAELVTALLDDDLAMLAPRLARHDIPLAEPDPGDAGAGAVTVPAFGSTLLVAGTSGGGKSTVVTGFLERVAERGYQHCIVDPEGDYAGYEGAVMLGDARRAPTVDEVMDVLAAPGRNVVANLLGVAIADRPQFCGNLLSRLADLRARTGRPHWIVLDETHQLVPSTWQAAPPARADDLNGFVLVTVHPQHVAAPLFRAVDIVLATGREPRETLAAFAAARGLPAPRVQAAPLAPGEAIAWWPLAGRPPRRVRTLHARAEIKRHARKYAEGELGPDKSFFFRGPDGRLYLRAQNLRLFLQVADGVDAETWLYHLRRGDYSAWIRDAIKDEALAVDVESIEAAARDEVGAQDAGASRAKVRAAIDARYTAPP